MKYHHDTEDWNKSFMRSIHQMHVLIEKHLEQRLAEQNNISFAQFLVLLPVRCPAHVSQSQIAESTNLTEATVSRHMSTLTEEGFLTRTEDPDNRRKHILALTAKGERAITDAKIVLEAALEDLFSDVSLKDRTLISTTFDRITTKLLDIHPS